MMIKFHLDLIFELKIISFFLENLFYVYQILYEFKVKEVSMVVISRVFKLGLVIDPAQDPGHRFCPGQPQFFYKTKRCHFCLKKSTICNRILN
jgi:hypothetical protein